MKKFFAVLVVFGLALSGCTSIKVLTPSAVEADIGGLSNLQYCQFFISKDVTLKYDAVSRVTQIGDSGTVEAHRTAIRQTIHIPSSLPGIMQTQNSAGQVLDGYDAHSRNGRQYLSLFILFEENDDNALEFQVYYDMKNDRFELYEDKVNYGGLTYSVNFAGSEYPYLKYELIEDSEQKSNDRKLGGRTISH